MAAKNIEEWVAEHVEKRMSALARSLFCDAMTAQVEEPTTLTAAKIETLIGEWANLKARMRRLSFTVIVRHGYEGDMIIEQTPTEGTFCEMSWHQADYLHRHHWPLVLDEIVDEHTAHLRPAHSIDMCVPAGLPMPPYEIATQG